MGSRKTKWVIARKERNYPVRVVAGLHFRLKKRATKVASKLNRKFKPRKDIKFVVRKEGWNRKRWYS